jgi:hypothetical protein
MKDNIKALIVALLDDDYGITGEAFDELCDLTERELGKSAATKLSNCVSAAEGRIFFRGNIPSFLK